MAGKGFGGNKGGTGGLGGGSRPVPVHVPRPNQGGVRTGDSSSTKPAPSPPITKGRGKE
jgi:hypothetical protein